MLVEISDKLLAKHKEYWAALDKLNAETTPEELNAMKLVACSVCNGLQTSIMMAEIETTIGNKE